MAGRTRVVAGAMVAALVCSVTAASGAAGAGTRAGRATWPVGVRTKAFVDRSRATPADAPAGIPPSPSRRLETTIYYPARRAAAPRGLPVRGAEPARGRYPLVIFSPGAPGTPEEYEVLLADWAAHGYVVAALTFPVSSVAGPDDVAWRDLPAQTTDVRYVLGKILDLDPTRARIPRIDGGRIGVAGHSFGGATALSLVSKCCRDRRVDVAVALAAVTDTVRGPKLRGIRGPVLFVHARADRQVPYAGLRRACEQAGTPKRLLTVEEIRGLRAHVFPYVGTSDVYSAVVRPAIVDFLDGYLRGERPARDRLEASGTSMVAGLTRCRPAGTDTAV